MSENNKDVHIRVFGYPRSGGTLVHNIIGEIFREINTIQKEIKIVANIGGKSHGFFGARNDRDIAVVTYRDFRDCLMSIWRVEEGNFDSAVEIKKLSLDAKELKRHIEYLKQVENFMNMFNQNWDKNRVVFLRYSDFYENYRFIFENVINKVNEINNMEISLPDENIQKIIDKWSRKNVRKTIQSKFKDFSTWDGATHIHGNHIGTGETGIWKKMLSEEDQKRVTEIFQEQLLRWEFEL